MSTEKTNQNGLAASAPAAAARHAIPTYPPPESESEESWVWAQIKAEAHRDAESEPALASFLYATGFLAVQAHRVSHLLWAQHRRPLALALQSRIADVFAVDIHPAARIGKGILLDHATGVVVGDRHPKIGDGVLIGAGATILGNIRIGEGAKIGAGSVVLIDVPPRTTAVGNPARLVGGKDKPARHDDVPSESMDHTSFIQEWSDYII
ncbi:Serine acetyltransferase, N-terminal [Musa troglodytarum]|uniref:serine O-acetyltransferase n=1 Tax=Musa troglodytarum TaxID=320322 RepID=A0A9E7JQX5_9LILI|nr:Serine acetyltransferase, N-terminal [Musa troglodytarum]